MTSRATMAIAVMNRVQLMARLRAAELAVVALENAIQDVDACLLCEERVGILYYMEMAPQDTWQPSEEVIKRVLKR